MARKLRPHEGLAFWQTAAKVAASESKLLNARNCRKITDRAFPDESELQDEMSLWGECSWPDEWGW